jgi:hypothetical protein
MGKPKKKFEIVCTRCGKSFKRMLRPGKKEADFIEWLESQGWLPNNIEQSLCPICAQK